MTASSTNGSKRAHAHTRPHTAAHTRAGGRTRAQARERARPHGRRHDDRPEAIGPEGRTATRARAWERAGTLYVGVMRCMYTIYSVK